MIIIKLQGGLGNQIFQYAFGRAVADKLHTVLKLDVSGYSQHNDNTPRQYNLPVFKISEKIAEADETSKFKGTWLQHRFRIKRAGYYREKQLNKFDPQIFLLDAGRDYYFDGYWQTEKYFMDYAKKIRQEFFLREIRPELAETLKEIASHPNPVSLHIRRGDYLTHVGTQEILYVQTIDYYRDAIKAIEGKISDPYFYVFTDDYDWANKNITAKEKKIISFGKLKDYEELIAMSACRHHIIANSSFSWWGAWLDEKADKIVIGPKLWFKPAKLQNNDLVPEDWLRL